jgi:hypothetical protein
LGTSLSPHKKLQFKYVLNRFWQLFIFFEALTIKHQ